MKYKLIGKVKEPHGLRGDLYVLVFSKDVSWLPKLKSLQLRKSNTGKSETLSENDDSAAEVQFKKPFKDGFLVKLKTISDRNQSEAVKGFEVWIADDLLVSEKGETIFLNEILGFDVYLKEDCVGRVESFTSNGPQDIVVIRNDVRVFEVPFVKEFIVKIDFEAKQLLMDFPEGLMNLDDL